MSAERSAQTLSIWQIYRMRTFVIYKDKIKKQQQKIEILDTLYFQEGQKMLLPQWSAKKLFINEIIFSADMQGENCSVNQILYVKETE